jgi:hypothetical protein
MLQYRLGCAMQIIGVASDALPCGLVPGSEPLGGVPAGLAEANVWTRAVRAASRMREVFPVLSVEEIRAQRPREVVTARTLSIIATVLWAPILGYLSSMTSLGALLLFFYVFGSFGAAKGRQAARIMVTIALALTYLFLLPYCWLGFRDPYLNGPAYAVMDIVSVLMSAVGLWLLYRPRSNRYFHLITVARQAG